ncbi:hypothetical protein BDP27DRAFT_1412446 [Rhodocollybia butyracea]|uniref:BTB domain-containing protein n=1 Tax=Rhodocollybia butyracea TaxID=206335 RepID=A0A9P5QAI5_9AGAR|nr:hypothetical protein BDP27DRAFT_1412446 [Rhodocollybia butyracea]
MFSDIDSPTVTFGFNRGYSRTVSPNPFYYPNIVGPPTLALESMQPERGHKPSTAGSTMLPSINTKIAPGSLFTEYYFDHPMPVVLISVQGRLFKVLRYFLERDSEFLRGVLSTMQEAQTRPLEIEGVSIREFKSLLDFFYRGMYRSSADAVPVSEWIDLLAAASVLKFEKAKEHAINAIDKASEGPDAVEMIFLAEKYGIERWLRPAYISLCKRKEPLQLNEAETIGMEKTVKLIQAREEFLKETLCIRTVSPLPSPYPWPSRSPLPAIDEAGKIVDRVLFASAAVADR